MRLLKDSIGRLARESIDRMLAHAAEKGAHAVIAVRYDATEIMQGVTEVLCYGTAVQLEIVRTTTS